jgi:hypothetical protein
MSLQALCVKSIRTGVRSRKIGYDLSPGFCFNNSARMRNG